ncbi:stage II sporulation protein R [Ureibacillus manganicus]|uniref:stage II sporulation protein R n=1 Tax=Ureibacillus manganicus TaxID=1266064 RepID=UPI0006924874|nr:stage II sporulation protein R [Ureibacillus manganicus]
MLNDYEITREENPIKYHPIISVLRLIASAIAVYCVILMAPQVMEQIYETRGSFVDDSLKIRVVANSNTVADQKLKETMVEDLSPLFHEIKQNELLSLSNEEALSKLSTAIEQNYAQHDVKITLGKHVIPAKVDVNYFYPQSLYNSLVVTIGSGRGDNFWCSIFPDVCEGPSSAQNDNKTVEEKEEKEVVFVIWEWILSLFGF